MAPKITGLRKPKKPAKPRTITKGQYPQRQNRQKVSKATVTAVGEDNIRISTGRAKVTGAQKALPPGRQGGALAQRPNARPAQRERYVPVNVREVKPNQMGGKDRKALPAGQNALPAGNNSRRQAAQNKLDEAAKGSRGSYRVRPPAGYAAEQAAKAAAEQAQRQAATRRNIGRGTLATAAVGALLNAPEEIKKGQRLLQNPRGEFQRVANDMGVTMFDAPKPKPKTNPTRPALSSTGARISDKQGKRDYEAVATGSAAYNNFRDRQIQGERNRLKNVGNPPAPKPSTAGTQSSGYRPRTASQQPTQAMPRPKQKPASATEQAATSGIGPVKDAQQYRNMKLSIKETVRELQEMRKRSQERQKKK